MGEGGSRKYEGVKVEHEVGEMEEDWQDVWEET